MERITLKHKIKSFFANLSFEARIFGGIVVLAVVISIVYLSMLNPSSEPYAAVQERFLYGGYSIPQIVAMRYVSYGVMRDFYLILYYGFNIISISASITAIAFAAATNENSDKSKTNKSAIIVFSILALVFTSLNMLINPQAIARTCQSSWQQLEQSIIETVYDTNIIASEKNIILTNTVAEIEKEMTIRIYP